MLPLHLPVDTLLILVGRGALFEGLLAHPHLLTQLQKRGLRCTLVCPEPSQAWLHAVVGAGFPVYTHIRELNTVAFLEASKTWLQEVGMRHAIGITGGWGEILSQTTCHQPHMTWYNLHPSLLPSYAGAMPCKAQVWFQDPHGGVTLHQTTTQVDGGGLLAQYPLYLPNMNQNTAGMLLQYYCKHDALRAWLQGWLATLAVTRYRAGVVISTQKKLMPLRVSHHRTATRRLQFEDCLLSEVFVKCLQETSQNTPHLEAYPAMSLFVETLQRYARSITPFAYLLTPLPLQLGFLGWQFTPSPEKHVPLLSLGIFQQQSSVLSHLATLPCYDLVYQYGTQRIPLSLWGGRGFTQWLILKALKIVFRFKLAQSTYRFTLKLM
jgi:hypothetical protein